MIRTSWAKMIGLSSLNLLVGAQIITMVGLGVWFWTGGNHRLAIAQAAYCVATAVIFGGK